MKKVFSLLTICLFAFSSFASNSETVSVNNNDFNIVKETKNQITIKLTIDEQVKEYVYSYDSQEDLFNANIDSLIESIAKDIDEVKNDACTMSISATVSIGWGSSYISVTVTVEASCATWKAELKKLIADMEEVMNE